VPRRKRDVAGYLGLTIETVSRMLILEKASAIRLQLQADCSVELRCLVLAAANRTHADVRVSKPGLLSILSVPPSRAMRWPPCPKPEACLAAFRAIEAYAVVVPRELQAAGVRP
jgi:Bacterial regulatory proteins, crp family